MIKYHVTFLRSYTCRNTFEVHNLYRQYKKQIIRALLEYLCINTRRNEIDD